MATEPKTPAKRESKRKANAGDAVSDRAGERTKPRANAHPRAREKEADGVVYDALTMWIAAIAEGETERMAAVPVHAKYGVAYRTLRYWCERDPEGWGEALAQAHGVKEATWLEVIDGIIEARGQHANDDPSVSKVRAWAAMWRLSKHDRDKYGDHRTTALTGADGGPVKQEVQVRGLIRVPPSKLRPELPAPSDGEDDE